MLFFSCNPSARLEKLRWPVMIVILMRGQKYSKFLEQSQILEQNLAKTRDNNIFRTPCHCLKIPSSMPISSLKQFHSLIKIHKLGT